MSSDESRWTPTQPAPGSLEALQAEIASLRAEVDRLRAAQADQAADAHLRHIVRAQRDWRRPLGALCLVVACVLAPLAVCSIWLRGQITNTDRYVETVSPLSRNRAIDAAVAAKVTSELFGRVDVEGLARQVLPPQGQFLAGTLASGLRTVTQQTAERLLATPQFHRLWDTANRVAHQQVVALVKGEKGGLVTAKDGKVLLNVGPITSAVQAELHSQGVTVFDGVQINSTFELVQSKDLARASRYVRYVEAAGIVLPVVVVAAFFLAVALSEDRRHTLVRGGLGLAFAVAVMLALVYAGRGWFLDSIAGRDVPRDAAGAFFDTVVRFLRTSLRTAFTIGIVVAAGAWLTGPSTAAVRLRAASGRALTGLAEREDWEFGTTGLWVAAHRRALRYGAAIAGAGILVLLHRPGPRGVMLVTVAVVVAVAVIEVVGRAMPAPSSDAPTAQPRLFDG